MRSWLFLFVACHSSTPSRWQDELRAESPCYDVNLSDGLDPSSSKELGSLFSCINREGNFESLAPLLSALDTNSPDGNTGYSHLLEVVSGITYAGIDPFALFGLASAWITAQDRPFDPWLKVFAELYLGLPHESASVHASSAFEQSVLVPIFPLLPGLFSNLSANQAELALSLANMLTPSEDFFLWANYVSLIETPSIAVPRSHVFESTVAQLQAFSNTSNDHWALASQHSLRETLITWTRGDNPLIARALPLLHTLLDDERVQSAFIVQIDDWLEKNTLKLAIPQLIHLLRVDARGSSLQPGEESAFFSFLRLIDTTNTPLRCHVELGVLEARIDLGNMAVTTLKVLGSLDPRSTTTGVELLADVFGLPLTDDLVDALVDSNDCPLITPQLVRDLDAVTVLASNDYNALITLIVDSLRIVEDRDTQDRRLTALINLIELAVSNGGLHPIEELLRDLDGHVWVDHLLALFPLLLHPENYGLPEGSPELDSLLSSAVLAIAPENGNIYTRWRPVLEPFIYHQGTWTSLERALSLLQNPQSKLSSMGTWWLDWQKADPEFELLTLAQNLLNRQDIVEPALHLLQNNALFAALTNTVVSVNEPLPATVFVVDLFLDGTFESLLQTFDRWLTLVQGESDDA